MARFCGGFVAARASRPTGEIHDEVSVNVDGELGTVMQTNIEMPVEFGSKLLSITLGECCHTTTSKVLTIRIG